MRDIAKLWFVAMVLGSLGGCAESGGGAKTDRDVDSVCEAGDRVACSCGEDEDEGTAACDEDGEVGECRCDDEPKGERDAASEKPADAASSKPDAERDAAVATPARDAAMGARPSDAGAPMAPRDSATAPAVDSGPAMPPGQANPGMNGPYPTTTEENVGPGMAFTMVRPRELGANGVKHPIITWGNGTGATPRSYTGLLNRLASHGFVVIASNSTNTGSGNEMLQGVDWVLEQNMASGSPLFGKIDPSRIGATGHSQGGFGTCQTARDARIKTIAPIQGFRAPAGSYAGSIFAISGGMDTIVAPTGISSGFDRLSKGPAMYGELKAATHTDWIGGRNASGSAYFEAVTAWMRVHLMEDAALRSKFYGAQCGLCSDAAWTVKQKGMD